MHIQLKINHTYLYPGTSGIIDKQLLTKELRLPSVKKKDHGFGITWLLVQNSILINGQTVPLGMIMFAVYLSLEWFMLGFVPYGS